MIKKIVLMLTCISLVSITNFSHAALGSICQTEFIPLVQRNSVTYTFTWDAFDSLVYPTGLVVANGSGPVPILPFSASFAADAFIVTELKLFINETYQVTSIWNLAGIANLVSYVGGTPNYHPDGSQACTATGFH